MFQKNTQLYFNPGCALSIYRPESVKKIYDFLKKEFPQIKLHTVCCRHQPQLPAGSVIINVCAGCDQRFSTLYDGIQTISLWEVLCSTEAFPFPNYGGRDITIHDPCPVRGKPAVHRAVRELMKKMNLHVVEAERNGTNSVCCGDSFYPQCTMEEIHRVMKKRADSMPCQQVAVYCVSCIKSMCIGGKEPRYLVDLLLGEETDPQECDTKKWHDALDAYIKTH